MKKSIEQTWTHGDVNITRLPSEVRAFMKVWLRAKVAQSLLAAALVCLASTAATGSVYPRPFAFLWVADPPYHVSLPYNVHFSRSESSKPLHEDARDIVDLVNRIAGQRVLIYSEDPISMTRLLHNRPPIVQIDYHYHRTDIPLFKPYTEDHYYSAAFGVLHFGVVQSLSEFKRKSLTADLYYPPMPSSKFLVGRACGVAVFSVDQYVGHTRISLSNGLNRTAIRKCLIHSMLFAVGFNVDALDVIANNDHQSPLYVGPRRASEIDVIEYIGNDNLLKLRKILSSYNAK